MCSSFIRRMIPQYRMYLSYDPYSYLNDPLWGLEIQSYIVQTRRKQIFREANETLLWHIYIASRE